jgi:hypothetical protein
MTPPWAIAVVVLVTVVDFHLGGAGSQRDGVFQEMLVFFPYVGRDGVEMLDVDVLVRRGPLVVVNSGVVTDDTTVGQARQSQQDDEFHCARFNTKSQSVLNFYC